MSKRFYLNRTSIHKLEDIKGVVNYDDEYLIYNPDNNYWIISDYSGIELIKIIKKYADIDLIKEYFESTYNMNDNEFNDQVIPYIEYFVNKGFISDRVIDIPKWMDTEIDLTDIKKYMFGDIYISLSDTCNLKCIYCFNKINREKRNSMNKSLLSRNKIFDILKEFKELGGNRVVFTGGEPTLNPDLVDIVSCTKQLNLEQHIITNGVFLNKLNLRLLVDNISQFNISIDTTDLSEISKLWNVPNYSEYYSELINGIDKLNSAIVDYKGEKPKVTIMPVVTRINLNSIIDLMKTINNRFLFKIYWKFTKYGKIGIDDIDKKLEISDEEYLKVLYDVGKKALSLDEDKAVAFAVTHCGERIIRDKPMMGLCSPSFFVTNHGDVYPCQGLERDQYYLGSIYDNSLTELYNKNIFSDIRKTLFPKYIKKCAECDLRFICNERCSLCNLECTATKCKDAVIRRMYYKLKQG